MSHVLEHCHNAGQALQEVRRVLADNGRLFIFVPPYTTYVCSGHVSTGWNVGELLYVLLLNGFDVRAGHFVEYGHSVCGFVRKASVALPALRGDRGDIRILAESGLFPLPVVHDQPPPNPAAVQPSTADAAKRLKRLCGQRRASRPGAGALFCSGGRPPTPEDASSQLITKLASLQS